MLPCWVTELCSSSTSFYKLRNSYRRRDPGLPLCVHQARIAQSALYCTSSFTRSRFWGESSYRQITAAHYSMMCTWTPATAYGTHYTGRNRMCWYTQSCRHSKCVVLFDEQIMWSLDSKNNLKCVQADHYPAGIIKWAHTALHTVSTVKTPPDRTIMSVPEPVVLSLKRQTDGLWVYHILSDQQDSVVETVKITGFMFSHSPLKG